ncbi:MAG: hypothetical protein ACOCP8_08225 [archaeon]
MKTAIKVKKKELEEINNRINKLKKEKKEVWKENKHFPPAKRQSVNQKYKDKLKKLKSKKEKLKEEYLKKVELDPDVFKEMMYNNQLYYATFIEREGNEKYKSDYWYKFSDELKMKILNKLCDEYSKYIIEEFLNDIKKTKKWRVIQDKIMQTIRSFGEEIGFYNFYKISVKFTDNEVFKIIFDLHKTYEELENNSDLDNSEKQKKAIIKRKATINRLIKIKQEG